MKISHCGKFNRAEVKTLRSQPDAYVHQILCRIPKCQGKCKKKLYYWYGVYANGRQTDLYPIPKSQHSAWDERAKMAKPENDIQMTGDYTLKCCRGIDSQLRYQSYLGRKRRMPWKTEIP